MASINRLPSPDDGVDGIVALADALGWQNVFEFIRYVRTAAGAGRTSDPGREALTELARRMIAAEQEKSNVDFDTARRAVADRLGYKPDTRTNFNKLVAGQVRPDRRYGKDGQ